MWVAALSRLAGLFLLAAAVTLGGALVFGIALGADAARSISVGFYHRIVPARGRLLRREPRGPVRFRRDKRRLFSGAHDSCAGRHRRSATRTSTLSAVFFVLGFVLILVGVAADNRYDVV